MIHIKVSREDVLRAMGEQALNREVCRVYERKHNEVLLIKLRHAEEEDTVKSVRKAALEVMNEGGVKDKIEEEILERWKIALYGKGGYE